MPRSACRKAYNKFPILHPDILDNMVCASYFTDDEWENEEAPCGGDSGDPLVNKRTGIVVRITS